MYPCLGVSCHLHFAQNDWGLLLATAVTRVGEGVGGGGSKHADTEKGSTHKANSGEENSPAATAGIRTQSQNAKSSYCPCPVFVCVRASFGTPIALNDKYNLLGSLCYDAIKLLAINLPTSKRPVIRVITSRLNSKGIPSDEKVIMTGQTILNDKVDLGMAFYMMLGSHC